MLLEPIARNAKGVDFHGKRRVPWFIGNKHVTKSRWKTARKKGLGVFLPANTLRIWAAYRAGVDGIISDRPDRLLVIKNGREK